MRSTAGTQARNWVRLTCKRTVSYQWVISHRSYAWHHGNWGLGPRTRFDHIGAWIIGRNMFGPVRGAWPDDSWKGWWGPKPPYHTPVFVLTHHPRESVAMEGGTTFHFVTDGIHAALERARAAAGGRDVRLGGGVASVQQYLRAAPRRVGGRNALWRWCQQCWAQGKPCSPVSIWASWVTHAPGTSGRRRRCTCARLAPPKGCRSTRPPERAGCPWECCRSWRTGRAFTSTMSSAL